jgi:hypothetical protein
MILFMLVYLKIDDVNCDGIHASVLSSSNKLETNNQLNGKISKLRMKSVDANVAKSLRFNCTATCSFQMSFDDQFQRPWKCSQRVTSYVCIVQVVIVYNTRCILISFITTGSESSEGGFSLYAMQQFTYIFNLNISSYIIEFGCFFGDGCEWTYARDIINQFTKANYTFVYDSLKSLLYDNPQPSKTVSNFIISANYCIKTVSMIIYKFLVQ